MSYYRICPKCGKGTVARYATDDSLCGECSDNSSATDKLSVEKLQEQLNIMKKALTEIEAAVAEFADDDDYNFNFAGNLASEALAAIGGDDD